jgi:hypothetical protein
MVVIVTHHALKKFLVRFEIEAGINFIQFFGRPYLNAFAAPDENGFAINAGPVC